MPKNLTEVDEFPAVVTVPVGTDARTAASVEVGFQALADRTRWLATGVERIREVTDVDALKALAGVTPGQWCYVLGLGLYRFQTGVVLPDMPPMYVLSPGQGVNGVWTNVMMGGVGVAGGAMGIALSGNVSPSIAHFGTLSASDSFSLGAAGEADFDGEVTLRKRVHREGSAWIRARALQGANADTTYGPDDADIIITPNGFGGHTYALDASHVSQQGAVMTIVHPWVGGNDLDLVSHDPPSSPVALDTLARANASDAPHLWSATYLLSTSGHWLRIG